MNIVFHSVRPECSLKQSVKECIEGYRFVVFKHSNSRKFTLRYIFEDKNTQGERIKGKIFIFKLCLILKITLFLKIQQNLTINEESKSDTLFFTYNVSLFFLYSSHAHGNQFI